MSTEFDNEQITQAFGQLAEIEKEFEQSEVEILRYTTLNQAKLFEKRDAVIAKIKGFWPHVLEDAAGSCGFDEYITPEDAMLLIHVSSIKVTRPNAEKGDPRDIQISVTLDDNDWTPAQTIVKDFTYQSVDGRTVTETGLISKPVEIKWKAGKDLTFGVNKAAIEAFEERVAGNGTYKKGPKEEALLALLMKQPSTFFNWFSYSGVHLALGEEPQDDEEAEKSPVEPFAFGDEIAISFAEDVYPSAVKYFTTSLEDEDEDEDDEDIDIDSDDDDEEDSHANCSGKHGHSHSHDGEPAKKKARK
ncbi:hypothetical protein FPQ18DRAFT_402043 [Pyronema domesticum]|uniref:Similar to Putative nucleosome assembly protein C36B7.08c acc. no. Q9HGN2 n=1 Tax=Pyronema omphalodes (strain CBS 100304) TaxID=1076935 RepID=U4L6Z9_PYROM|nr:hypothetical protein FPQ18DRAFT_402043 [Pyronema domesticum]CCX05810.1 Similar to Putative nucleosome assembly protein C36B7.08c; acc. no. Q9HGN2 [Pyronema omphalodes CBS 100304]